MKKIPGKGFIVAILLLIILIILNKRGVEFKGQDGFSFRKISDRAYDFNSVIHIKNNNLLSMTVKSIREKFYVDGIFVGELNNDLGQGIPGLRESPLPVAVRFSFDSTDATFKNIVSMGKDHWAHVEGEIDLQNFAGEEKLLVNLKQIKFEVK